MRNEWVAQRQNDPVRTQMYYARQGIVTGEMEYVAESRETSRRGRYGQKSPAAG